MVEKMKAMVLSELGPIETNPLKLTEIDRHEIQRPNELLIKIEACGVCHSQLHEIEGDWKDLGIPPILPTVPGHEVVGKVVEIGKNVTKFKVGDRAGISPLLESCMKCQYCKEGNEHLCESMQVLGESLKGGYAEYVTVTEDFATKIPETMRPEYAAPLFCAGVTAYKAVKASEPYKNEKIGLLDAAIVFAPADIVTNTAIKAIKKGGLVVIGTIGEISNFVAFEEKTIRGTLIGSRNDMKEVIRIANEKNIKVFSEVYRLEQANEVLAKLKTSEIEARAVLVP